MMRDRVAEGRVAEEDERSADWIDLLPRPASEALVVGCGWGAVPSALASRGARVVVVDPSPERLGFVAVRAQQDGLTLRCVLASDAGDLPVRGAFDLVAFLDPASSRAADADRTAREAARLLRPGGSVAWRGDNALALTRRSSRSLSLRARYATLRRHGFTDLRAYAPLPDRGIPFFHVPLGHDGPMRHFLGSILPLAATAPAATRERYGSLARLASLAMRTAGFPLVARAARIAVPGHLVLGRAGATRAG